MERKQRSVVIRSFCLFMLLFVLMACSKTTKSNYAKIKVGMAFNKTCQILGEPDYVKSKPVAGFHAVTALWKSKKHLILVQLFNEKVQSKYYR